MLQVRGNQRLQPAELWLDPGPELPVEAKKTENSFII
jgi:hypothetical protein